MNEEYLFWWLQANQESPHFNTIYNKYTALLQMRDKTQLPEIWAVGWYLEEPRYTHSHGELLRSLHKGGYEIFPELAGKI